MFSVRFIKVLLLCVAMAALASAVQAQTKKSAKTKAVSKTSKAKAVKKTAKAEPSPTPDRAAEMTSATKAAIASGDLLSVYVGKKFTQGPPSLKKVALTFDDGPHGKLTPQYIEILKKENVPATFFMLGESVQKYPTMAKTVADAGFEIGCHTQTHRALNKLGMDEMRKEIIGTSDLIEQTTGKRPRVMRPPYGSLNSNVLKVCAEAKEVAVLWSVDTNDWKPGSTPASVRAAVDKEAHGGAVILMHDVHEKSLKTLEDVIKDLKAKGYEFVTLSDMIGETVKHNVVPGNGAGAAGGAGEAEAPAPRPTSIPLSASK